MPHMPGMMQVALLTGLKDGHLDLRVEDFDLPLSDQASWLTDSGLGL